MATISERATIVLTVNGKQANQMLSQLENKANTLRQKIANAAAAGNKADVTKLTRQLKQVEKQIAQINRAAQGTGDVMQRLDSASPRELNKALRQMTNQLNGLQRGTKAYDQLAEKIRIVRGELQQVNSQLHVQQSRWDRLNNWLNNSQTLIMGVAGALSGLIMAGRPAVNAYAEMEQEMANVRKYTGMSAEDVESLNKEFTKIDTRTSREDLNKLAQEAGRLGKTSQEDVLGFVRAADKINVALDDLGNGATLTLSKLTGIFGDEKRLGTEKALLSVGSVINELSQNCSASAPYLAEFASRVGGVGSQAGLTVQQIMGYAAVLDSNNQALEASATALSQVMVRIYQDPAKYARVAGLDAMKFTDLVKKDMNEAMLLFLQTLNKAGGMDVLSPMFKDMGENGSRAISALSTLARQIDEVKSQQLVANEAFEEATSIDKEFEVQNTTVLASLDKAKNRVHELAVELGEKLQPAMRFVISSTTLTLKFLKSLVEFFIEYKREIGMLCISIVTYTVIAKGAAIATQAWNLITMAGAAIAKVARIAVMALRIGYLELTNQVTRAEAMTRLFNRTTKASQWGIIIALLAAAAGAVYSFYQRMKDAREETERQRKEMKEWEKSLTDIDATSADYSSKEITRLKALYSEATNEALSKEKRRAAAEKLQNLYPDYFKNLSVEQIMVGQAKQQYENLTTAILNAARARAAAAKIEENEKAILELESEQEKLQSRQSKQQQKVNQRRSELKQAHDKNDKEIESSALGDSREMNSRAVSSKVNEIYTAQNNLKSAKKDLTDTNTELKKVNSKLSSLNNANKQLAEKYKVSAQTLTEPDEPLISNSFESSDAGASGSGNGGGSSSGGTEDKFAAEKEWRERQEALARIAYAKGETDLLQHETRMNEIEKEFYNKQLEHDDLSENERLQIQARYYEAKKKLTESRSKEEIEKENKDLERQLYDLQDYYLFDMISKEAYDRKKEELEIKHQENIVALAEIGSEKRMLEDKKLNEMLMKQKQDRQKEYEELERKYASMKKDYFGDNPAEKQKKYDDDLKLLDVVYNRELEAAGNNAKEKLRIDEAYEKAKLALKKKYGLLNADEEKNSMQKAVESSIEWLNSDGGKAVTGTIEKLTSGMSAIFSELSSMMQAELEIQTAEINKRYDAEISRAEGNSYQVKKLEKEKEREIAKAKNEANRKMFAMQVIQAVAQTATNALNAYGSAAAVPVVGYVLAPIAAAMAVAAGALQIASIKKQAAASEAQGYQSGGFTPEGKPDQVAGVVHAGEWIASQKLVKSPKARPIIEALDYVQRTNRIADLKMADVSYSVAAPAMIARKLESPQMQNPVIVAERNNLSPELTPAIEKLVERLDEPFFTVNSVTGEYGSKKAEDEYKRLIKNKSPKKWK